jgi:ABC-type antimicrobial peptide transport system permease subunit
MDNQGFGWLTIVGVVGDVRHLSLTLPGPPETYLPMHQRPTRGYSTVLVLRTGVEPTALVNPARAVLQRHAPDVTPEFMTLADRVARSETERRFTTVILSSFALVALLLSAIGIYGVVSYTAAQRTQEMGIRLALGADPGQVRGLVQRRAMAHISIGLALGAIGALVAGNALGSLLYQVGRVDPLSLGGGVLLLALAGWLGSWIPARRVAKLDPLIAIRTE